MATRQVSTYDTPHAYDRALVQYDFPPLTGWPYDGIIAYGAVAYDTSEAYDTVLVDASRFGSALPYDAPGAYDTTSQN